MPEGALAISYLFDGDNLIVFALTRETFHAAILGSTKRLSSTVETYRRLISGERLKDGQSAWQLSDGGFVIAPGSPAPEAVPVQNPEEIARYLSKTLLEPLAESLSGAKLVIISTHGVLAALPFETLPVGDRVLILDHDVSYIQSVSMLGLIKSRGEKYRKSGDRDTRKDLFAMGDAIYRVRDETPEQEPRKVSGEAGIDMARLLKTNAGDSRGVGRVFKLMRGLWPNLPGTGREIGAVSQLFEPERSAIYVQKEATEAKLRGLNSQHALKNFRYLLFSAHGFLSTEEPGLSALVLGQVDLAPATDGYITAAKWPGYDLDRDLVVLSACETGLGKIVQGEGVMGLPYALFVAGNRNTVLSLWPVYDDSTAAFMALFFAKLKAGMTHSAALSETKREFLAGPFKAPAYWAPFILYGY